LKEITKSNKIILFFTSILAGYEIVSGIEGYPSHVIILLTISFGILLLTSLLLIFLGFGILEQPAVVVIASVLPLGISSAVVAINFSDMFVSYLLISLVGFLTIILSRFVSNKLLAVFSLASVHAIAGLIIFISPLFLYQKGVVNTSFLMVSLGGAFIGLGGIFLLLLRANKSLFTSKQIYSLFPTLLFFMTISFIIGFSEGM